MIVRTKANIDKLQFGYWDAEAGEFVPIIDGMDMGAAAEKLGCSELLLDALVMFAANISSMIDDDLRGISA